MKDSATNEPQVNLAEVFGSFSPCADDQEMRETILETQGEGIQSHISYDPDLLALLASVAGLGIRTVSLHAEPCPGVPGMIRWFVTLDEGPAAKGGAN